MKKYKNDTRYEKVYEQMQLLGIQDVTTERQNKNGTVVWRLPIKNNYPRQNPSYIEVASFSTGYVRNQNSGYSNYQLNKRCEGEPQYFKLSNGDYRKFTTRSCVLIPIEIDRLEYLLKYCVKNYYIKHANQVPNGDFYPKWMYENEVNQPRTHVCDDEGMMCSQLANLMKEKNDEIEDLKLELSDARNDLKDRIDTIKHLTKCYHVNSKEYDTKQDKMDVKQAQLIDKIERIKTFLKHELL